MLIVLIIILLNKMQAFTIEMIKTGEANSINSIKMIKQTCRVKMSTKYGNLIKTS